MTPDLEKAGRLLLSTLDVFRECVAARLDDPRTVYSPIPLYLISTCTLLLHRCDLPPSVVTRKLAEALIDAAEIEEERERGPYG